MNTVEDPFHERIKFEIKTDVDPCCAVKLRAWCHSFCGFLVAAEQKLCRVYDRSKRRTTSSSILEVAMEGWNSDALLYAIYRLLTRVAAAAN